MNHLGKSSVYLIVGLTLTCTSSLLIFNTVYFHKTFDTDIQGHTNIFRLVAQENLSGGSKDFELLPSGLISNIQGIDGIQDFIRIFEYKKDLLLQSDNNIFRVNNVLYTDRNISSFLALNKENKLPTVNLKPNEIIISTNLANRIFGDSNPIGQILKIGKGTLYSIALVVKNNKHSHIQFDIAIPIENSPQWSEFESSSRLDDAFYNVYLKRKTGFKKKSLENSITHVFSQTIISSVQNQISFHLIPISKVHIKLGDLGRIQPSISSENIDLLILIGCFVIFIGFMNYSILCVSETKRQFLNYQIRYILGASRLDFLLALFLRNLKTLGLSLTIGSLLFLATKSNFNYLVGNNPEIKSSSLMLILSLLGIIILFVTCLSLFIMKMIEAEFNYLRNQNLLFSNGKKNIGSQVFACFQLAIAFTFLLFAFTSFDQIQFGQKHDLGFNPRGIIVLKKPLLTSSDSLKIKYVRFRALVQQLPQIKGISNSTLVPTIKFNWISHNAYAAHNKNKKVSLNLAIVDQDFINLYDFRLLSGENLSNKVAKDNTAENILINEAAARTLEIGDVFQAVGKNIYLFGDRDKRIIKGIIEDFNHESLKNEIQPIVYFLNPVFGNFITLKMNTFSNDYSKTIEDVKNIWNSVFQGAEMDYSFMEDSLSNTYITDRLQANLLSLAGVTSLLVSFIGILGIVNQLTTQKFKAIIIKKILGAPKLELYRFMATELLILTCFSAIFSIVTAFHFSKEWLNTYAYRIELDILDYFLIISLIILFIFFIISERIFKVIGANPITFLRQN